MAEAWGTERKDGFEIERKMLTLSNKMEHLEERINHGLSETIKDMKTRVEKLEHSTSEKASVIEDSRYWVSKYKEGIWWTGIIAVGGGMAAIIFQVVRKWLNLS